VRHVQVAEMVIEKAKRLVEHGRDQPASECVQAVSALTARRGPADSFRACPHSEGRNHRKRMTKAIKASAACYDCNPILAGGDDVVTRSHENLRCTVRGTSRCKPGFGGHR